MKHTRRKLVLIMLISMVVAFVVIALAFQLIVRSHVRSRAENSISLYMNMEDEEAEALREETESSMVVTSFTYQTEEELNEDSDDDTNWWDEFWDSIFNDDYWNSEDVMQAYYSEEISAWWETSQPEEYSLNKVEVNGKTLYVSWARDAEKESKIRFYYVNVSSEEQLIKTVSISLYIIMAICLAGACLAGFFMGKKIEDRKSVV